MSGGGGSSTLGASPARRARAIPGLRLLLRRDFQERLVLVLAVLAVAVALLFTAAWRSELLSPGAPSGDPWNYLAAAERLRDGHPLYAIGPEDRAVLGFPGEYPLPLMSPPTVAFLALTLTLAPAGPAMVLWMLGGFVATLATTAWVIARGGMAIRALIILLSYPIATTALSGNVNAYLLPTLCLSWLGLVPGRGAIGGVATGVATIARIGPAAIGLVYVVCRRWRAVSVAVGVVAAVMVATTVMAGPEAWRIYVDTTLHGSVAATPLSVTGMLEGLGLPASVGWVGTVGVWIVAFAAIVLLRDRPRAAFVVSIVAVVYATPIVRMEYWALLLAATTPWLLDDRSERTEAPVVVAAPIASGSAPLT